MNINYHKSLRKFKKAKKKITNELTSWVDVEKEALTKKKNRDEDYYLGNNKYLFYWRLPLVYDGFSFEEENLGDYLSKVVVKHFVPQSNKANNNNDYKTIYAVGSVLGLRCQDAVIWGSGILYPTSKRLLRIKKSSIDIRAVRGPLTRNELIKLGKHCPEVYGDPAILMPLVFMPEAKEKKYKFTIILNHNDTITQIPNCYKDYFLSIVTTDYKAFITRIVQSELIISSSLHGIILAESYGVPAVLLRNENEERFKYEDWYYSTNRKNIITVNSIEEAMAIEPMELPDLSNLRKKLVAAFPYDLWINS